MGLTPAAPLYLRSHLRWRLEAELSGVLSKRMASGNFLSCQLISQSKPVRDVVCSPCGISASRRCVVVQPVVYPALFAG
jgi:hypothetical protein